MFGLWEREREILDRFCVISSHKTSTKLVVGGWWLVVGGCWLTILIRSALGAGLGWAGLVSYPIGGYGIDMYKQEVPKYLST